MCVVMCKREYNRCHKIVFGAVIFGAVIVRVDLHNRIVFGVVIWLCPLVPKVSFWLLCNGVW
jgi:hypothetical protein